jgi:hypothetical protein
MQLEFSLHTNGFEAIHTCCVGRVVDGKEETTRNITIFFLEGMVSDKLVFGIAFKEQDSDILIPHFTLIKQTKPSAQGALKFVSKACFTSCVSVCIVRLIGGINQQFHRTYAT